MRVPEGWVHTTFDKHTECLTGFAFKSINYSNNINDIRLLRGDNIEPNALRWRDAKYWDKAELINLQKYLLLEGDFVIALDRTWISNGLKVAEVRGIDIPCLLVQRVVRIRTKPTLAQGLLKHYFSGYKFEQYVKSVQTATAVPHISPNDIKEFPVLLPPLPEQQKIAQILSTWDKAITTTEQLLFNSQQQKKALMQQLLTGKKRLLDEDGVRFSGERPEYLLEKIEKLGWAELGRGNVISKKDMEDIPGEYPIYSSSVKNNGLMGAYGDFMFEEELISWSVDGGGNFFYRPKHKFSITNVSGYIRLDTNKLDYQFIAAQLEFLHSKLKFDYQTKAHPSVIRKMYILAIPTLEEQTKIATVLSTADREIELLQTKLEALKQEKKALMQQLLTGKRRVKLENCYA